MDEIVKSSILMDEMIANRGMLNSVLKKDFELFSEDITIMLNNSQKENNDGVNESKVDLSELKILKEKEKNRIQDLKRKLIFEQKQIQFNNIIKEEEDMDSDGKTSENLKIVSNKLLTQFANFSGIYENENKLWTNKEFKTSREGNDVVFDGHKILEANTKLDKLQGFLKHYESIHNSYENITSQLRNITKNDTITDSPSLKDNCNLNIVNNRDENGLDAISKLQYYEQVLINSILRREKENTN